MIHVLNQATAPQEYRSGSSTLNHKVLQNKPAEKWSFVTRRVDLSHAVNVLDHVQPQAGDLVKARVKKIAQHTKLQLRSGRRSQLYVNDEIVVAYGNRYAPDQFEALVPKDLRACHLVASGGIAAQMITKHDKLKIPTAIQPIGLLADQAGRVLNLSQYKLASPAPADRDNPLCIGVLGTSMNAGKTTTAAHLARGFTLHGLNVAVLKVTGTGAGNDLWAFEDAGAYLSLDFTDVGLASTYKLKQKDIESCFRDLVQLASADQNVDVIIVEVADGLLHRETSELVKSELFQSKVNKIIFAAGEALGANAGVQWLERLGLEVIGISGALSASSLAITEAENATGLRVYRKEELADTAFISTLVS